MIGIQKGVGKSKEKKQKRKQIQDHIILGYQLAELEHIEFSFDGMPVPPEAPLKG
jgi:hypothetical protein